MLVIPVKEGENIDRALKKFKKKFERTGTMRQLRSRQAFIKPSVRRRKEVEKAKYKEKLQDHRGDVPMGGPAVPLAVPGGEDAD